MSLTVKRPSIKGLTFQVLGGLFVAHMQQNKTFLDSLFNTNWTTAKYTFACDFEPSSEDSVLMVYDTLCSSSVNNPDGRTCREYPVYKERLQNLLPAASAA
jgi:hypothetical protein